MPDQWADKIFNVHATGFTELALEIFGFQYQNNSLYRAYADMLGRRPGLVSDISELPFLPISFFKTHPVKTTDFEPQAVFESSGTTGGVNSHHLIRDPGIYRQSFVRCFELSYGPVTDWCIIGLLPSYLERNNSSLVFMVDELIRLSGHADSGFYLHDFESLHRKLKMLEKNKQQTLLIGVSFALLDFAENFPLPLKHTVVMETGGMKGRREEMIRQELHETLRAKFETDSIHSEYGMTELLSQAYSKSHGLFHAPPWMKIIVRDEEDPLAVSKLPLPDKNLSSITGAINIIDLANIYSCSFIATDDAGKLFPDGSFEVLGRLDNSDIRGCSLLAANSNFSPS